MDIHFEGEISCGPITLEYLAKNNISLLSPRFSNRYVNICNFYMNNLTLSVPIAEDRGCPALLDVCPA